MSVICLDDWNQYGIKAVLPEDRSVDPVQTMKDKTEERITLDLHIGDKYERSGQWRRVGDYLELRSGESVRIATREKLYVSKGVFGLICSRAALAAEGLQVATIKVDPQFAGWLEVAVFNGSNRRIRLEREEAFASIFFMLLKTPMTEHLPRTPTPTKALGPPWWKAIPARVSTFLATVVAVVIFSSPNFITRRLTDLAQIILERLQL